MTRKREGGDYKKDVVTYIFIMVMFLKLQPVKGDTQILRGLG